MRAARPAWTISATTCGANLFAVLVKSLEEEAQLTLMGRLMARSDIILWLSTRLRVTDTLKQVSADTG